MKLNLTNNCSDQYLPFWYQLGRQIGRMRESKQGVTKELKMKYC